MIEKELSGPALFRMNDNKSAVWLDQTPGCSSEEPDLVLGRVSEDRGLDVWRTELWPGRNNIRPLSSMTWDHFNKTAGTDISIYNKYQARFWAMLDRSDNIKAIAAGHQVDNSYYRTRGIWVASDVRGGGLISCVLWAVCREAADLGCSIVWTLPRKKALNAYIRAGFTQDSEFFDEGVLYGPNCYAICRLTDGFVAKINGQNR